MEIEYSAVVLNSLSNNFHGNNNFPCYELLVQASYENVLPLPKAKGS